MKKKETPKVIWLLPVFFGFIGGVIAAVVVGTVYKRSWWQYLVTGIVVTLIWGFIDAACEPPPVVY